MPFRRLCADFGAEVTMSEMSFARHLLKGDPLERARLKRAANEACFGFQIATNNIGEGVGAGKMAIEAGASWLDLNCGCPIYGAPHCQALLLPPLLLLAVFCYNVLSWHCMTGVHACTCPCLVAANKMCPMLSLVIVPMLAQQSTVLKMHHFEMKGGVRTRLEFLRTSDEV